MRYFTQSLTRHQARNAAGTADLYRDEVLAVLRHGDQPRDGRAEHRIIASIMKRL